MKEYLELGSKILSKGNSVNDRTNDGCISLFGEQLKFDLSKGLPFVTTKKLAYKSVISELLWFISGSVDRRHLQIIQHGNFDDSRFDIWKANAEDVRYGADFNFLTIGNMYGRQWRKKETPTLYLNYINPKLPTSKNILDAIDILDIVKCDTQYQQYLIANNKCKRDNGSMKNLSDKELLVVLWGRMIDEIESRYDAMFHPTGICEEWLNYHTFAEDVVNLPYFNAFYNHPDMFVLTPMYYGSDTYDINTCIFMYKDLYEQYKSDMIFAINGCDEVLLPRLVTDQFDELLVNLESVIYGENYSPSRRLIIDAWNPNHDEDAVLATCHPFVQFSYVNGKLNCSFYQRSADYFLGLPFNIASYAVLTHIIAQHMKVEVGELTCSLGDVHIYNSHIDAVKEQLNRVPLNLPTLKIKDFNDIEKLKLDDFEVIDYNHHTEIKAEMMV